MSMKLLRLAAVAPIFLLAEGSNASPKPQKPAAKASKSTVGSPVRVLTAMSTSLKSGHPLLFLNGDSQRVGAAPDVLATRLQFPADQKYSKWSVIFSRPITIDLVEVETCKETKPFADGVELFLDYNERRYFADGGNRIVKFTPKRATTALTLNFLESAGLCLESVRLTSKTEWLRPRTLPAIGDRVIADGSLGTFDRAAIDGKKLKLDGARKPGVWKLQWENPLIVDGLVVWNGNQHPGASFGESDRVKDLEVILDRGEPLKFALDDRRGFQILKIESPRAIRSLELRAVKTFTETENRKEQDPTSLREPVMGEVQILAGGETWVPIVPASATDSPTEIESTSAKQARNFGFGDIIDRELRSGDSKDVWKFRFRSDGTFFARFYVDRVRVARAWSAIGTWKILSVVRTDGNASGLVLSLAGSKAATAMAEDSLPCAEECSRFEPVQFHVEDIVEIQTEGSSSFFLRNRTPEETRSIEFSDLKFRVHSLYD